MFRIGIVLLLASVGCVSTTSHTSPFVSTVEVANGNLVVTSCDVAITMTRHFDGHRSETATNARCTADHQALPVDSELVAGAPPGCTGPAASWDAARRWSHREAEQKRRQLWAEFPRVCRAYFERTMP